MRVPVKDAELYCSSRGDGPPCLVLSGIGTRPYERQTAVALGDRFRLVYVDLRGSGESAGDPGDLSFDVLAEDLEAIRSALGLERVAVLAHSILGVLAIEYGRRCPQNVSHVITAGTPPVGDMARVAAQATAFFERDASEDRKRVLRQSRASLPPEPSLRQMLLAQTPLRFFDPRFDAAPLLEGAVHRPALLKHVMETLTPAWDVSRDAATLRVPLFVALGRHDYVVPHVLWEGVAPRLPGATVRIFERSGHQPFFEEPEAFAAAVADWMRSTPAGGL